MLTREQFFEGLISCVMTQGRMGIPGFGTFVKQRREAQADPVAGLIHPPGNLFVIQPYQDGDGNLYASLSERYNVRIEEVEKFIQSLVIEWNGRLENKEIIEISNFGRIFREFTGELNFVQELSTSYSNPSNLPILPFRPINRSFASKAKANTPIQWSNRKTTKTSWSHFKSRLTSTELLPITIAAASFLVLFGVYLLLPNQPDFNNQSLSEKVKVERLNQKPSHLPEATLAKDTLVETPAKSDTELAAEVEKVIENSSEIDEQTTVKTPTEIIPDLKEAIIITGAYRNIEGVKRKIDQIVALGFNPYKDKQGDINRVGVIFSYHSEADIQRILNKVQAQISPRAWVLIE